MPHRPPPARSPSWRTPRARAWQQRSTAIATPNVLSLLGLRPLLFGMQDQLLHPPIQDFSREDLVLGWTSELMDPAELLELLSGFAQHAEHFALEAELVDTARIR